MVPGSHAPAWEPIRQYPASTICIPTQERGNEKLVRQQQEATEHDTWFRHQVQIGLDSANAGNLIPAEEVEKEAAEWKEKTRRKGERE